MITRIIQCEFMTMVFPQEPEIARKLFKENIMSRNECFNIKHINHMSFLKVSSELRLTQMFCSMYQLKTLVFFSFVTARIRRMGKVMFSVCPHLGGGVVRSVQLGRGSGESSRGSQVSPAGGKGGQSSQWGESGQCSWQGGGSVQPAGGGSVQLGESASCTLLRAVCLLCSRRRTFLL